MKVMGFDDHLATMILEGKKTATWRMFDDKDLTEGDIVSFGNSKFGKKEFAQAKLTKIDTTQVFQDMYDNWGGRESYGDIETMVKTFQGYYPAETVTKSSPVKVIDFELL